MVLELLLDVPEMLLELLDLSWRSWRSFHRAEGPNRGAPRQRSSSLKDPPCGGVFIQWAGGTFKWIIRSCSRGVGRQTDGRQVQELQEHLQDVQEELQDHF